MKHYREEHKRTSSHTNFQSNCYAKRDVGIGQREFQILIRMRKENDKSFSFSIIFPYSFSFFLTDHLTWTHTLNVAIVSTVHRATGSCSSWVTPQNFHIHHSSFFFSNINRVLKRLTQDYSTSKETHQVTGFSRRLFKSLNQWRIWSNV